MKFMQIKPQKARGLLAPSMWEDDEWVVEEKYDGDRRIAQFCLDGGLPGSVRFTGTRESVDGKGFVEKTANVPHLCTFNHAILDSTVLDGEIVCPETKGMSGGRSKYVTAVMGSAPARALALQQQNGWMRYMVFDCLWYKGRDIRGLKLKARRAMAARAVRQWSNQFATMAPQYAREAKNGLFDKILKRGGEGVVLKHVDHTYGDERLWVKVKGEWTADVVIMDLKPGKGKNAGSAGAIIFGQWVLGGPLLQKIVKDTPSFLREVAKGGVLERMGSCRGFDDALMRELTKHPKKYLNQVIEITHNGREPTGAFRHPRFKRFRPDKAPKDCVYREDEV